jgi:glutathione S-transferase
MHWASPASSRIPLAEAGRPFGQVPFLKAAKVERFESGACLLHLARKSEKLMPREAVAEGQTQQWTIAALNSIEMVTVPWWFLKMSGDEDKLTGWLTQRLDHMERVLSNQQWLAAGRFTVADLLMAGVLRIRAVRTFGKRAATEAYVARVTEREAFKKALADQTPHFEAADRNRAGKS